MRRTLLAIATAAAFVGSVSLGRVRAETRDSERAPEIQVSDWINGDGRVSLADHRGEVVLLDFWSSH